MTQLPSGTVTFLLTDVEGSTALWEEAPEAMRAALLRHDALFEQAIRAHGGVHIRPRGEGDSRFAVFASATDSIAAAVAIQRAYAAEPWPTPRPIKVRIGLHTSEAEPRDGDYYGAAVNRCARLRGAGHGGQILLSEATAALVRLALPDAVSLGDLGKHRLRDVASPERVFQVVSPDLPGVFPPLRAPNARPHTLPIQRSGLIGREHEIAAVCELLLRPDVGLVTLIGPGGTGKTRLATHVALEVLDQFRDGVHFVALAAIRDPDFVAATIGQALSVSTDAGRPPVETLKDHLADRELLLVLDNLEQVLEVGPHFVELLAACPRLKLLATSRIPLRVSGEREYEVPPLSLPQRPPVLSEVVPASLVGQYDAIQLFVERAQAVRADFALTDANAADVVEICRRLDGLPLAIELAAARARLLPPSAMLARLVGATSSPSLRLLTGGARDQPVRLQALRNTIAWSYDLLEPGEQALFRRLAGFVGGFTLEAAEAIGAADIGDRRWGLAPDEVDDGVESLLTKSLLRRIDSADGEPRYTMLETIREYGLESLALTGELSSVRRWHAGYFLELAEMAEPCMRGPEQRLWLNRLEAERDNLRAALDWSLAPDGDAELALRLSGALAWFWYSRSHVEEARRWLVAALSRAADTSVARIKALAGAGRLAHIQHDSAQARGLLSEGLALARELGDSWWIAWLLHLLGRVAYFEGEADTARAFGDRSLEVARSIGDEWLEGWALHLLALASHIDSDFATARRLYEESLAIRRRLGFHEGVGTVLTLLGLIDFREGDHHSALLRYRESLDFYWGLDWGWLTANMMAQFVALAVTVGQAERAARVWGALTALSEAVSVRPIPLIEAVLHPALEQVRLTLGEAAFASALQEGRRMSRDEVKVEVLAIDVGASAGAPTLSTATRSNSTLPAGLTTRELEVLRLIVSGATSKEIAEELVISIHTVERHITHIYQKIGARGRAEATAFALASGLA
jgi:predicted ATPase/class 3 adenylate cyclase/DNA-binding CsgD family transcriptional regulator